MLEHHLKTKRIKKKNIYKLIYDLFKKKLKKNSTLIDIGCGNGDFLNFVYSKKKCELHGLEPNKQLFKFARAQYKDFNFFNIDFAKYKSKIKYDVITAISVVSHFDNIEFFLDSIKKIAKKDSNIIFSGIFNPNNIDVYVKYKFKNQIFGGHNQHNIKRVYTWAAKNNYRIKVKSEELPFTISKKNILADPARSFTTFLKGKKMTMNGLQVIYNIQIIHLFK